MAASEAANHHWVLLVDNAKILKSIKSVLETSGVYDKQRLIHRMPEGSYAIPITGPVHDITGPIHDNPALSNCKLAKLQSPDLTKKAPCKRTMVLQNFLDGKISELPMVDNVSKTEFLRRISLIKMYQHSDMTIISNMNFDHPLWRQVCSFHPDIWADIGKCLKCKRLAIQSGVTSDDYRSPDIELVLGMDGWVEHIDNGIKYIFDVTKCMFCRGNITEKLRMANLSCKGETIVDLFAG
jgi:tRNA wybutosine-synthesizing protein 2